VVKEVLRGGEEKRGRGEGEGVGGGGGWGGWGGHGLAHPGGVVWWP